MLNYACHPEMCCWPLPPPLQPSNLTHAESTVSIQLLQPQGENPILSLRLIIKAKMEQ